jgi:hypothetical protein
MRELVITIIDQSALVQRQKLRGSLTSFRNVPLLLCCKVALLIPLSQDRFKRLVKLSNAE